MKSLKLFLLVFLLQQFSAIAQKKIPYRFDIIQTDKNFARITDSLFAYKFECSNSDYRIFLNDLIQQGRIDEYKKYEVDSTQWRKPTSYNEPYVLYYHRHPAYRNYPVVNITHDAADAYCKWLTEKYNSDKKRKFKKVIFKLPSESEWKLAAHDGNVNDWKRFPVSGSGYALTERGKLLCNYLRLDEGCFINDSTGKIIYSFYPNPIVAWNDIGSGQVGCFYTCSVHEFAPTKIGLYNMAGNVAEMLDIPGRTIGGSWQSIGGYLRIDGPDEYSGFKSGRPQIGFRVFMQIIEK